MTYIAIARQESFNFPWSSGYLQITKDGSGEEHARIASSSAKEGVCPPSLGLVTDFDPHDLACAIIAMHVRYPRWDSEKAWYPKLPSRLRNRSFPQTAERIEKLAGQPLHGYPIDGNRAGYIRTLHTGGSPSEVPAVVEVRGVARAEVRMLVQPTDDHQEERVDTLALAGIHNKELLAILRNHGGSLGQAVNDRIERHLSGREGLRWRKTTRGNFPTLYEINEHYLEREFAIRVDLYHSGGGWASGIAATARNNRVLVESADSLAARFAGRYRVARDSAWSELESDAKKFVGYVWRRRDARLREKDKVWVDISNEIESCCPE